MTSRERNTRSGISGLAAVAWRAMNAASSATASAAEAQRVRRPPAVGGSPRRSCRRRASATLTSSTAPGASAPRSRPMPRSSGSSRVAKTPVAIPIGRLTKKIQCQLIAWVRTPPASRPIAPPAAATKLYTPIALACSDGFGNIVTIIPRITAEVIAPPMPWTNRAPINSAWLSASPQTQRRGGEHRQPGEEDPPAADQVAEPADQQQQTAERDQVRVHDPREARLREVQVASGSTAAPRSRSSGRG